MTNTYRTHMTARQHERIQAKVQRARVLLNEAYEMAQRYSQVDYGVDLRTREAVARMADTVDSWQTDLVLCGQEIARRS